MSLSGGDGPCQGVHLAAAFCGQWLIVIVVLERGYDQQLATGTGIKQFPARFRHFAEPIVDDEDDGDSSLECPVDDGFLTRTDGRGYKYGSLSQQVVALASDFLLVHAT